MIEKVKNGNYVNIVLTDKVKKQNGKIVMGADGKPEVQKGLSPGESVIFEKSGYAEGKEINTKYGVSYLVRVIYEGDEVSFFLNKYQHDVWKTLGGVGDKVKVSAGEGFNQMTGAPMTKLKFEKAE